MTNKYEDFIKEARNNWADDDLTIDDKPAVSVTDDGVWVAAWVWVEGERGSLDKYVCACGHGWEEENGGNMDCPACGETNDPYDASETFKPAA